MYDMYDTRTYMFVEPQAWQILLIRWPIPSPQESHRSPCGACESHGVVSCCGFGVLACAKNYLRVSIVFWGVCFFPWQNTYIFWDGIVKLKSLKWSMMLFHWEYGGFSNNSMWFQGGWRLSIISQVTIKSQFHASSFTTFLGGSEIWSLKKDEEVQKVYPPGN